jgi:pyruvate dehydrogenase E1 component alpha subunit
MQGRDLVAVAFLGDAAANQGIVWESLNLAGLWKLPVLFVVEDNGFSEYTPAGELTSSLDFAGRAAAWGGVSSASIDGNDALAVYAAAAEAVERARSGGGPSLINCKTYRWMAHNEGEEAVIGNWSYRSEEEVKAWQEKDPIVRHENHLIEIGILAREEIDRMRADVEAEMEQAVAFAGKSPFPEPEEAFHDVFVGMEAEKDA